MKYPAVLFRFVAGICIFSVAAWADSENPGEKTSYTIQAENLAGTQIQIPDESCQPECLLIFGFRKEDSTTFDFLATEISATTLGPRTWLVPVIDTNSRALRWIITTAMRRQAQSTWQKQHTVVLFTAQDPYLTATQQLGKKDIGWIAINQSGLIQARGTWPDKPVLQDLPGWGSAETRR